MLEMNKLHLMDCMAGMKDFPDNYFDLAMVDPPYGIGRSGYDCGSKGNHKWKNPIKKTYIDKGWDQAIPQQNYFDELTRISMNQIIWGGNYFIDYLKSTMCVIAWDKEVNGKFSEFELAWTSFNERARIFKWMWNGFRKQQYEKRFHPTQKPVALYRWLLKNYAKPGDKILDTHVGSGSSLIACIDMNHDYIGFELDPDYHAAATKRINDFKKQGKLFN